MIGSFLPEEIRRVELYIRVPERWCQEIGHAGRAIVEIVHSLGEGEFFSPAAASFWRTPTCQLYFNSPGSTSTRKIRGTGKSSSGFAYSRPSSWTTARTTQG